MKDKATLDLTPMPQVIERFKRGEMVIICDDADRENEGDLCIAVEHLTAEDIAFMMRYARGLICVTISAKIAEKLSLPLQVHENNSVFRTPFAPTITLRENASNHGSAASRLSTLKRLIADDATPDEFITSGSVYPLIANPAGVVARKGQTEGGYDLTRLAGLKEAAIIVEILNEDGTMARSKEINTFAKKHNLATTTVRDILQYRIDNQCLYRHVEYGDIDTEYGSFKAHIFHDDITQKEHLALVCGELVSEDPVLTRVHSECLTGDIFGSQRCDCGGQLSTSLEMIQKKGSGVLLYLRQEGRGIGLSNKVKAYHLQDGGLDTVQANIDLGFQADERDFLVAASMLKAINVKTVELLTNNPKKVEALQGAGITVEKRIPLVVPTTEFSKEYMRTKREKLGHLLA